MTQIPDAFKDAGYTAAGFWWLVRDTPLMKHAERQAEFANSQSADHCNRKAAGEPPPDMPEALEGLF